ncbi:hypothetical protein CONLIGDRAFT_648254 [Coniochaeta ligniaria NRRL 30616]|uniref:Uncharacterized protein n=1 Tax=Coniochaeta ligniaria NRRL 30616 TaxID=1408157 RepID=A0A1J7JC87_9PEZI|nr:hypothetical protein CONLIGDRAFT_648254 [Coniochaeta ligniaria NRRL 30616]
MFSQTQRLDVSKGRRSTDRDNQTTAGPASRVKGGGSRYKLWVHQATKSGVLDTLGLGADIKEAGIGLTAGLDSNDSRVTNPGTDYRNPAVKIPPLNRWPTMRLGLKEGIGRKELTPVTPAVLNLMGANAIPPMKEMPHAPPSSGAVLASRVPPHLLRDPTFDNQLLGRLYVDDPFCSPTTTAATSSTCCFSVLPTKSNPGGSTRPQPRPDRRHRTRCRDGTKTSRNDADIDGKTRATRRENLRDNYELEPKVPSLEIATRNRETGNLPRQDQTDAYKHKLVDG